MQRGERTLEEMVCATTEPQREGKLWKSGLSFSQDIFLSKTQAPYLSLLVWSLTIQATVAIVSPHAVVLQDVQHPGHLTEDEHTRTWEETKNNSNTDLVTLLNFVLSCQGPLTLMMSMSC